MQSQQACTAAKLCPQLQPTNASCTECESIFKEIAAAVPSNFTLKDLTKDMYSACDQIKNFTGACKLLVVGLAPALFDAMTGATPPAVVCDELKLCPHADSHATLVPAALLPSGEAVGTATIGAAPEQPKEVAAPVQPVPVP